MTTLTGGGLFAYLSGRTAAGDRIYPRRMPREPVFPLVLYRRIDTARGLSHTGPDGLASPRIQLDVWAEDPDQADAVADELRVLLNGYRGAMGDVPVGLSRVVADLDDDEPNTGLYRRILDAEITHREATA
ncbi:MAG: DUF3168 domain-containing protein [Chloroflexota bacterium]